MRFRYSAKQTMKKDLLVNSATLPDMRNKMIKFLLDKKKMAYVMCKQDYG